jgi:hypothetical protein
MRAPVFAARTWGTGFLRRTAMGGCGGGDAVGDAEGIWRALTLRLSRGKDGTGAGVGAGGYALGC